MSRLGKLPMGHQERETRAVDTGLLILLQNAWSPVYAGSEWPRAFWLPALARSPTGLKLRTAMAASQYPPECCWNVNPLCGATSGSKLPVDPEHVDRVIERYGQRLRLIVACGKVAESAIKELEWDDDLGILIVPHPAARPSSNVLWKRIGDLIETGLVSDLDEPLRMQLKLRRPKDPKPGDKNWTERSFL